MKHKRAIPEYQYRAYKYFCIPTSSLPAAYFEERRRMIALWNELCELDAFYAEQRMQFARQSESVRRYESAMGKETDEDRKRLLERELRKEIRLFCKEHKYREPEPGFVRSASELAKTYSDVHWGNREAILHSFVNAREKLLKRMGGRPKTKTGESRISFQLRFTAGGKDIHKLYKQSNKIFSLYAADRFRWRCRNEDIAFNITLHRAIPLHAAVKTIRLKEARNGFYITFSCEFEPEEPLCSGDKISIFQPRWTSVDGMLVIGVLQQGLQSKEITIDSLDCHEPQSKSAFVVRSRRARALHSLAKKAENNGEKAKAYWSRKRDVEQRMYRHRDWCYWNFAKRLASESSHILLRKMNIKSLARAEKGVVPAIRRNLRLAAPSDLYNKIEQQAAKYTTEIRYWKDDEELSQILAEIRQKKGLRKTDRASGAEHRTR